MERKTFFKNSIGFLGMSVFGVSSLGWKEAEDCTVTNTETAGPFPTLTPSSLVRSNIVGDRTGVPLEINITVKNINGCNTIEGVMVDIWHCDKDGYYSQYGGTSMQTVNYKDEDFLRGRQVTDSTGSVTFTSIFPGWYTGRATHIHVHIYDSSGNTLLISQIAFPEGSGSAVETVNNADSYGYTKGMSGYTYNSSDNVFSDGTTTEMSTIAGSLSEGYTLIWEVFVNAGTTGVDTNALNQFQIRQNYPNPCKEYSNVPVVLRVPSDVQIDILTIDGKLVNRKVLGNITSGEHIVSLDVAGLPTGKYIYKVVVSNSKSSFSQSKLFIKQL